MTVFGNLEENFDFRKMVARVRNNTRNWFVEHKMLAFFISWICGSINGIYYLLSKQCSEINWRPNPCQSHPYLPVSFWYQVMLS